MSGFGEDILTPTAVIKLNGRELSDELYESIHSIDAESTRGATGWCRIVLNDPFQDLTLFNIDDGLEVQFDTGNATETVFEGDVMAVGMEMGAEFGARVVVDAYDSAHKLGSQVQIRTFVEQTDSDILSTIAGDCGLGTQIPATSITALHQFQHGTNQEFVEQICRRNGFTWRVADGKLIVEAGSTSVGAVTLAWGEDLMRLSTRFSASDKQTNVKVHGWDPAAKQQIVGTATPSNSDRTSTTGGADLARSLSGRDAVSTRSVVASQAHANNEAKALARRSLAVALAGEGEALGNPRIVAGTKITFENLADRWGGDYIVGSARHHWSSYRQYTTEFQFGPLEPTALVDVLGATRNTSTGPAFANSVTVAIVTNITDPETVGRVKVKFPYLSEDLESDWCRVVSIGAGAERGIVFHPEVDDEVLVAFEHGDLRRPYVIGNLWNGQDALPDTALIADGAVKERLIQSRVGHKIRLSDGDDDDTKFVSVELKDGTTKAYFGHSKVEVISNDKTIELKTGDASILLDGASGDITLTGANITIKADQKVTIQSGTDLEAKSGTGLKLNAGSTAEVKASAKMDVDGGGMLNLKGGMVKVN